MLLRRETIPCLRQQGRRLVPADGYSNRIVPNRRLAGKAGLEPATSRLTADRSTEAELQPNKVMDVSVERPTIVSYPF